MNTSLRALLAGAAAAGAIPVAAQTLSFDELPVAGGTFGVDAPALYRGFDLGNLGGESRWVWSTDTPPLVAASPLISLRTSGAATGHVDSAAIASDTPFRFKSAFFSGVPTDIYIELVLADGVTFHRLGGWDYAFGDPSTATFSLGSGDGSQRTFVNPMPDLPLSAIVIWGLEGTFAVDELDVTLLSDTAVQPAPEPGTYAMLVTGLVCVGIIARRRRRSAA